MRKIQIDKLLAATSLALTVAASGCSTNRYPGNGEPMTNMGYGAANRAATPGSSSGTSGLTPMASAYTSQPSTAELAEAAAQRGYRGVVLGPVDPAGTQASVPVEPTGGQVVPPAMIVNPQSTINATVSSPSGDQGISGGGVGGGGTVAVVSPSTVAGATVIGTPGVGTAAAPLSVTGALGVGATPASGTIVPATNATSPSISGASAFAPAIMNGMVTGTNTQITPTVATRTTSTATTAKSTTTTSSGSTVGIAPIRIMQNSKGQIVVSSATTAAATKGTTTVPSTKP
jgi:hypothetical protein